MMRNYKVRLIIYYLSIFFAIVFVYVYVFFFYSVHFFYFYIISNFVILFSLFLWYFSCMKLFSSAFLSSFYHYFFYFDVFNLKNPMKTNLKNQRKKKKDKMKLFFHNFSSLTSTIFSRAPNC